MDAGIFRTGAIYNAFCATPFIVEPVALIMIVLAGCEDCPAKEPIAIAAAPWLYVPAK